MILLFFLWYNGSVKEVEPVDPPSLVSIVQSVLFLVQEGTTSKKQAKETSTTTRIDPKEERQTPRTGSVPLCLHCLFI